MRGISALLWLCALRAHGADPMETALTEYAAGHLKAAEAAARAALTQRPESGEARVALSLVLAAEGDCQGQLEPLLRAWSDETAPVARRLAGIAAVQCAAAQDRTRAALTTFEELKRAYPADADVLYVGAKLYLSGWNKQVADMFANTPSSYRVNQLSGEIFETQNNFAEAAAEYAKATAKQPGAINLHFRRGRALLLASHEPQALEEARREFEAELAINADDAAALYQIGLIREAQGEREEASRRFEQAIALRPRFAEALTALGKWRLREKRGEEAIVLLERAVREQATNETAHYNLMLAYRYSGRAADAEREQGVLDRLRKPPGGEFTDFLNKLNGTSPKP